MWCLATHPEPISVRYPQALSAPAGLEIISGGQTGVDRGALLAALDHGVPCSGWAPAGRLAEDGPIPDHFPVTELPNGRYEDRTRKNVSDTDGTLLICHGQLGGGSLLTRQTAERAGKPLLLISADNGAQATAVAAVVEFVRAHHIYKLNVAGPRASEWPAAQRWVRDLIGRVLRMLEQDRPA